MNNNWIQSSNSFYLREVSQQRKTLPANIFKLCIDPKGEFFLANTQDSFEFPYKLYGMEYSFIERVTKTYAHTDGNLGILLTGLKGTGKTVTAQMICNQLQLPVIIISDAMDGISNYLNDIQQDIIVFFDEFEKLYNNYDHSILTVMDGVLNNGHRKVFLLTTNEPKVNENMLQRPSRLRYIKSFEGLSLEHIIEVIDDKLKHSYLKEDCINFISGLELITIDIVKAVIEEVNIHEESPENFKDVFNVRKLDYRYNVYKIRDGIEEAAFMNARISPSELNPEMIGENFWVNGDFKGKIKIVSNEFNMVVGFSENMINPYEEDIELSDQSEDDNMSFIHYRIESVLQRNRSFNAYAF